MRYLRRLELRLSAVGVGLSAEDIMEDMQHLHSVLTLERGAIKPARRLETPTKSQSEVLTALGHRVDASGVLQTIARYPTESICLCVYFFVYLLNSCLKLGPPGKCRDKKLYICIYMDI
jgi:hypothetical protein